MTTAFSEVDPEEWAQAWGQELNANDAYREVAQGWKNPLVFVISAKPGTGFGKDIPVYLDLHDGTCREARAALEADLRKAPYVLRVEPEACKSLFDGETGAADALMAGQITIQRGSRTMLSAYVEAADEMLAAAQKAADKLDIAFPPELQGG